MPNATPKELNLDEWKLLLINLFKFMPIRELYITGGEPTLRDDVSGLINFLLFDQRKCVTLHTNLLTENALAIKPTKRFRVETTFHHSDNKDRYLEMYLKYNARYRTDVHEIGSRELEVSRKRISPFEIHGSEIAGQTERFAIAPDGHMFTRMRMFYEYLSR